MKTIWVSYIILWFLALATAFAGVWEDAVYVAMFGAFACGILLSDAVWGCTVRQSARRIHD